MIREVKDCENLLWLLSTRGYGGGELLDIPRTVAMKLMEDDDFDHLLQIAIVGSILQEVAVDIIENSCREFSNTLLKIKLLYQQGRIRKYRIEPYQLPHNARRDRERTAGGAHAQGESLWNDWQERGFIVVDTDE